MELRKKALIGSISAGLAIALASVAACFVTNAPISERASLPETIASAHTGDVITMGQYGGKAMKWNVVGEDDDMMLLLNTEVLLDKAYNDKPGSQNEKDENYHFNEWINCSLRAWLNGEFYSASFNDEEKALICKTAVPSAERDESKGVGYTADYVFILSEDEFSTAKTANGSTYATIAHDHKAGVWFRGSSSYGTLARLIGPLQGLKDVTTREINKPAGVLPALWVARTSDIAGKSTTLKDNMALSEKKASSNNSAAQQQVHSTNTCRNCGKKGYRYSNPSGVGGNASAGTSAFFRDDANYKSIASHGYCVSCWSAKGK